MMDRKNALGKLRKELRDETTGEFPKKMQEVTVAAPNEEGLEEGLEMAKEVVSKGPEALMEELEGGSLEGGSMEEVESPESQVEEIMEKLTPEVAKLLIEKLASKF